MRITKSGYFLIAVLLLIPALVFTSQEKLSLIVEVNGATPGKGQAVCSLFTSADTFLNNLFSERQSRSTAMARPYSGSMTLNQAPMPSASFMTRIVTAS